MENLQTIVLAAGKSTRFKTEKSKLLHTICGQEMILHPITVLQKQNLHSTLVVGYQKTALQECIEHHFSQGIAFTEQREQLGTGHAIRCTQEHWHKDHILILNGDTPLVTQEIIADLYTKHIKNNADISFVIAHNTDPTGASYGRIIQGNSSIEIIEAKHFDGDPHEHCYINAGIYIVKRSFLQEAINALEKNQVTKELYITDLVKKASEQNRTIATTHAPFDRIRGVNTLQELWAVEQVKRSDILRYWMNNGVRFTMPQNVHLDLDVTIGTDTVIGGGVHIYKTSHIGRGCTLHAFSSIENSTIGDAATVDSHTIVRNTHISEQTTTEPFTVLQKPQPNQTEEDEQSSEKAEFLGAIKTDNSHQNSPQ